jgi:hypothetical protein
VDGTRSSDGGGGEYLRWCGLGIRCIRLFRHRSSECRIRCVWMGRVVNFRGSCLKPPMVNRCECLIESLVQSVNGAFFLLVFSFSSKQKKARWNAASIPAGSLGGYRIQNSAYGVDQFGEPVGSFGFGEAEKAVGEPFFVGVDLFGLDRLGGDFAEDAVGGITRSQIQAPCFRRLSHDLGTFTSRVVRLIWHPPMLWLRRVWLSAHAVRLGSCNQTPMILPVEKRGSMPRLRNLPENPTENRRAIDGQI